MRAADAALVEAVAALKKRGISHPFVKNYVLARTTPLSRARKTLPSFDQTFTKLMAAIEGFDVAKVRYEDVQRSSVFAAPAGTSGDRPRRSGSPGCPGWSRTTGRRRAGAGPGSS